MKKLEKFLIHQITLDIFTSRRPNVNDEIKKIKMKISLQLLLTLTLFVGTWSLALLNPKIDLVDLKEVANAANNRYCFSVPCPR